MYKNLFFETRLVRFSPVNLPEKAGDGNKENEKKNIENTVKEARTELQLSELPSAEETALAKKIADASKEDNIEIADVFKALNYDLGKANTSINLPLLEKINQLREQSDKNTRFVYLGGTDSTSYSLNNKSDSWHAEKKSAFSKLLELSATQHIVPQEMNDKLNDASTRKIIEDYINSTEPNKYFKNYQKEFLPGGGLFDLALALQRANDIKKKVNSGKEIDANDYVYLDIQNVKAGEDYRKSSIRLMTVPAPVEPVKTPVPPEAPKVEEPKNEPPKAINQGPVPAPVEPVPAPVEPVPAPVEPVPAPVEPVPAPTKTNEQKETLLPDLTCDLATDPTCINAARNLTKSPVTTTDTTNEDPSVKQFNKQDNNVNTRRPPGEAAFKQNLVDNKPVEDKPVEDKPAEDKPAEEKPTESKEKTHLINGLKDYNFPGVFGDETKNESAFAEWIIEECTKLGIDPLKIDFKNIKNLTDENDGKNINYDIDAGKEYNQAVQKAVFDYLVSIM